MSKTTRSMDKLSPSDKVSNLAKETEDKQMSGTSVAASDDNPKNNSAEHSEDKNIDSEDKFPFASDTSATPARKRTTQRGRKRRSLPKDAPKGPLSGYMLYMAEQRENIRKELLQNTESPPPSFAEVTKEVAHKWTIMDAKDKKKYLDASEAQRERYHKELDAYHKTDSYKQFLEEKLQKSQPLNNNSNNNTSESIAPADSDGTGNKRKKEDSDIEEVVQLENPLEIPIFTDQFLKHNKARELELKKLRKSIADYEEQNALLEKRTLSSRLNAEKLTSESKSVEEKVEALDKHLTNLRSDLTNAFQNTPAPGWVAAPTVDTIDEYLVSLHASLTASPPAHQSRATQLAVQQIVTSLILQ